MSSARLQDRRARSFHVATRRSVRTSAELRAPDMVATTVSPGSSSAMRMARPSSGICLGSSSGFCPIPSPSLARQCSPSVRRDLEKNHFGVWLAARKAGGPKHPIDLETRRLIASPLGVVGILGTSPLRAPWTLAHRPPSWPRNSPGSPDPSRSPVGPYRRSKTRLPLCLPRCAAWSWRLSQRSDGGLAPPRSCPTGPDASGHISRGRHVPYRPSPVRTPAASAGVVGTAGTAPFPTVGVPATFEARDHLNE